MIENKSDEENGKRQEETEPEEEQQTGPETLETKEEITTKQACKNCGCSVFFLEKDEGDEWQLQCCGCEQIIYTSKEDSLSRVTPTRAYHP
jgi:hypothetical protein